MYVTQEIACKIKSLAKMKGTPIKQLLSDCDLNINAISELSKGKQLSCISLAKIADQLDCSVDYLLGRSDEPDMINSINNSHSVVTAAQSINNVVPSNVSPSDEMSTELLKAFNNLSFEDRLDFLSKIIAKSKER